MAPQRTPILVDESETNVLSTRKKPAKKSKKKIGKCSFKKIFSLFLDVHQKRAHFVGIELLMDPHTA